MKVFVIIFSILVVTKGQGNGSLSGTIETKPGPSVSGEIKLGSGDAQNDSTPAQSPAASGSAQGSVSGGGDAGSFVGGIFHGIGDIIKGFAKPIESAGNTLCFAVNQLTNQALRLDDYIGQTLSISVNGKQIYNGTVTADPKRHHRGNRRNLASNYGHNGHGNYHDNGEKHYKKHGTKHASGEGLH